MSTVETSLEVSLETQQTSQSGTQPVTQPETQPGTQPGTEPGTQPETQPISLSPSNNSIISDNTDVLYNRLVLNTGLLVLVNNLKVKGFTGADIPVLILSIMGAYNIYTNVRPTHLLTTDELQVLLERVYNYLVDKYNLVDSEQRPAMFELFDTSIKLCLAMPNVRKDINRCLGFFGCK